MNNFQKYDRLAVDNVIKGADIRDFIPGCKRKVEQMVECPFCGKKKLSVVHKSGKNFAHCFACEKGFSNAVDAVMHYEKLEFLPALEKVAKESNIILTPREVTRSEKIAAAKKRQKESFCAAQLAASGLTPEDVVAKVVNKDGSEDWVVPFISGGVTPPFTVNEYGDEMLIRYFGLDGKPKFYTPKNSRTLHPYVRVRWSNPAAHTDEAGKEMKYKTPAGAPSQIYIPQIIRDKYQKGEHIDTLFLQEGEKKAEKACKHGMLSVGMQGINNFGTQEGGLLADIQYIIKTCSVNNVVLIMDSDWQDLHRNIISGDNITKRPNSFAKAVIKYKAFIRSLERLGYAVDIYWGHVNKNEAGDKGVDDLLVGSMKGQEDKLMDFVRDAMLAHDGRSTWFNIHKITTVNDRQIEDFWLLNDTAEFYKLHAERLKDVDTFRIRNIAYKVENGELVQLNRYSNDIDIYSIAYDSKDNPKVIFNEPECFKFLKDNGFARLRNVQEDGTSTYDLVQIDNGIIERCNGIAVRDFVQDYIEASTKKNIVLKFFYAKLSALLADKQLERLSRIDDVFNDFRPEAQNLYYNDGAVSVTAYDITPQQPLVNVWRTRIVPRRFRRVPIVKNIQKEGEDFFFELSPEAGNCQFFQYLCKTSINAFPHDRVREMTAEEMRDYGQHLINKITAIGYLLCDYKWFSERKCVVIQDHRMAEVGASNGGSGKSLIGNAIAQVTVQTFIDGKADDSGQFFFQNVTQATRNIFIDDIRTNFNFKRIYTMITADSTIERKNTNPLILKNAVSPKILLTTNHTINGFEEDATRRRIIFCEMSEWYNPDHTIADEFGCNFFQDWDEEQWVLFDNFMAECLMYYLRSRQLGWSKSNGCGALPPPMDNIELRSLRQEMSEVLFQWAEEYYDPSGTKLNYRLSRKEVFADFNMYAGNMRHGVNSANFRRKIEKYVRYKGYHLNIMRKNKDGQYFSDSPAAEGFGSFIGGDDKTGGTEYITVTSDPTIEPKNKLP